MKINILDFDNELAKAPQKSLLLGNGFGQSYDFAFGYECFSWNNLLALCHIEEDSPISELLKSCNLDFELAHQKLNNAISVMKTYGASEESLSMLEDEICYLKEQLVVAVSNSHPTSFNFLEDRTLIKKIRNCRDFLQSFDEIYSLNYDLLLYWLRCFEYPYIGRDSFTSIEPDEDHIFSIDDKANVYFPHGALFIYRRGCSASKIRSFKEAPILSVVSENIRNGRLPMCVSEGTGEQKKAVINNNEYLSFCYNRLATLSGELFTFGCSFLDGKDDHIIEAILRSNVTRVVVGDYNANEDSALRLHHQFSSVRSKKRLSRLVKVEIADTSKAKLW
ncbi:DUF4917 family protein [Vibrio parahaemolyticus]